MSYYADDLLTLELGDCVEVMRELPTESVDAVVTDPPYGLEFMGREWDRLGDVGQASHQGFDTEGKFKGFKLASYNASANVKCRTCNRWKWDHEGRKCECEAPDFANVKADQSRRMQVWHEAWAREAFRVARPGAHLLAFGGTRTYHRLASAIEDAGWEIRDCLVWAYASGFPKSLDVSKAIDKAAGAEREVVREWSQTYKAPATPDAAKWDGWGTALKPAWEPIVLARKPLRGTVAANVLAHGTGALNIGATRIPGAAGSGVWGSSNETADPTFNASPTKHEYRSEQHVDGRWPANLLLTDPIFDGGVPGVVGGGTTDVAWTRPSSGTYEPSAYGLTPPAGEAGPYYGDSGTYSRFFLVPKSSRSDREPLLRGTLAEGLGPVIDQARRGRCLDCGRWKGPAEPNACPCGGAYEFESNAPKARANSHPTVKPLDLMRHLVRLVTPPGGTVLDCFLGSGTTAIAANAEGFRAIGIEREQEYLDIAVARLAHQEIGLGLDVAAPVRKRTTPSDAKMPGWKADGVPTEARETSWFHDADEVPA